MKKLIVALLAVLVVVLTVLAVLGFSGIEPFSKYVDNAADWWEDTFVVNTPNGTYTRSIYGLTGTLTFSGDELTTVDNIFGKKVYTYDISDETIILTDVVSGANREHSFQYVKDHDIVVFDGFEYHKEP